MVKMYAKTIDVALEPNRRKPNIQVMPKTTNKVMENRIYFPVILPPF